MKKMRILLALCLPLLLAPLACKKKNGKAEHEKEDKNTEIDMNKQPEIETSKQPETDKKRPAAKAYLDTHLYVEFERDGQRIPIRELQLDLYYKEGSTYRKVYNPSTTSIAGYSLSPKRPCRINFYFPGSIGASPHEVESSSICITIDGGVRNYLEMHFDKRFPLLVRELIILDGQDTLWQRGIQAAEPVVLQIEKDGSLTHKK